MNCPHCGYGISVDSGDSDETDCTCDKCWNPFKAREARRERLDPNVYSEAKNLVDGVLLETEHYVVVQVAHFKELKRVC